MTETTDTPDPVKNKIINLGDGVHAVALDIDEVISEGMPPEVVSAIRKMQATEIVDSVMSEVTVAVTVIRGLMFFLDDDVRDELLNRTEELLDEARELYKLDLDDEDGVVDTMAIRGLVRMVDFEVMPKFLDLVKVYGARVRNRDRIGMFDAAKENKMPGEAGSPIVAD